MIDSISYPDVWKFMAHGWTDADVTVCQNGSLSAGIQLGFHTGWRAHLASSGHIQFNLRVLVRWFCCDVLNIFRWTEYSLLLRLSGHDIVYSHRQRSLSTVRMMFELVYSISRTGAQSILWRACIVLRSCVINNRVARSRHWSRPADRYQWEGWCWDYRYKAMGLSFTNRW